MICYYVLYCIVLYWFNEYNVLIDCIIFCRYIMSHVNNLKNSQCFVNSHFYYSPKLSCSINCLPRHLNKICHLTLCLDVCYILYFILLYFNEINVWIDCIVFCCYIMSHTNNLKNKAKRKLGYWVKLLYKGKIKDK